MAVVDEKEAEGSALAEWVRGTSADGDRLGILCLRTHDLSGVARRLGTPALPMGRLRPDGSELRWELAGLEETLADPALPFFIQWHARPEELPGAARVDHPSGATGIAWVEVACDERRLRERVWEPVDGLRAIEGEGGVRRVAIITPGGTLVLD